jgi:hypothetical protein
MVTPVSIGHVVGVGGEAIPFIAAAMLGNALVIEEDLYGVGIVNDTEPCTEQGIRDAVVMPVLPEEHMIVTLDFSLGRVLEYVGFRRKGL